MSSVKRREGAARQLAVSQTPDANLTAGPPRKRVIAVGKRIDGRWEVRTGLYRYLAATALSNQ